MKRCTDITHIHITICAWTFMYNATTCSAEELDICMMGHAGGQHRCNMPNKVSLLFLNLS